MTHEHLRYALIAFTALALGVPSWWIASRPSRPTSRLGMRGKKRQQGVLRSALFARLEPFVRWMGARLNGVLPVTNVAKLDLLLTHAGDWFGLTADELAGSMIASGVAAASLAGGIASLADGLRATALATIGAGIAGAALPYLVVDAARSERLRVVNRTLPNAIDLMALSMSAGLDFPGAVRQLVERSQLPEALRDELEYVLQQLQVGRTRGAVLRELAERAPTDGVRELSQAIIQAELRGNPVAGVLEIQASTSRMRRSNLAERAANDMKAKMVLPTMMLIAVGLMLIAVPSAMMLEKFSGAVGP